MSAAAANKRAQQAEATRERMLDLAWEMVAECGKDDFSIRQLALKAGVATGLPFAHFGSRDGLIDELRIRAWDEMDRVAESAIGNDRKLTKDTDFEGRIRRVIGSIVEWALANPNIFDLVMPTPGTKISDEVGKRDVLTAQRLIGFLLLGQQHGAFRFQGDPIVFTLSLWTSIQGYILRMGASNVGPIRQYEEKVLEEIFETFFSRIRARPRQASANE